MKQLISLVKKAAVLPLPFQTLGEEIANSMLHGLGALLAVAGLVLLVRISHTQLATLSRPT
jgi:predicted membrane channel-forming protein YqfA (hemolysin III family)